MSLLRKQMEKIRKKYSTEVFMDRLVEKVESSYNDFERLLRLKDRSIKLMSSELHNLHKEHEQKQESFMSTILGEIVDGIITCTEDGIILSVNRSAELILNKKQAQLIDGNFSEILSEFEDFGEFMNYYFKSKDRKKNQIEIQIQDSDGSLVPCEVSVSKFKFDEVAYIVILRDIKERKEAERSIIEEKEKAEQASRAKANFLSTMSHEIRTPMNAIIGMTNIMIGDDRNKDQMKVLNTLKFSSEHLLALINDILDLNKIEAGKVEFEKIDFNLKEVTQNVVDSNSYIAKEKGIDVSIERAENLPDWVVGDPSRLSQVLNNLIGNAVKFTDEGSVTIKIRRQSDKSEPIKLLFEIIDTGIGIAPEKQKLIFESFAQSETDTTRKYGGSGLGLTITKKLIELQNGELKVSSKPGKGSNFYFQMEFGFSEWSNSKKNTQISKKHDESYDLNGIRILLVEDNPVNQFVAGKFLTKWNAQFTIAENGIEALAEIQKSQYDLVLMDLQMPQKNGFDATSDIRSSNEDYKNIPIIALTATAILEEKNRALASGINDFVTKPFNPDELYSKIRQNLMISPDLNDHFSN